MMQWVDYPTYSLSGTYDVVENKNGVWVVVIKLYDSVKYLAFLEPEVSFETRADAKQWCEMHYTVGA